MIDPLAHGIALRRDKSTGRALFFTSLWAGYRALAIKPLILISEGRVSLRSTYQHHGTLPTTQSVSDAVRRELY